LFYILLFTRVKNLPFKKITDNVIDMRVLPFCLLFLFISCSINVKNVQDTELDDKLTNKAAEKTEEKIEEIKKEETEKPSGEFTAVNYIGNIHRNIVEAAGGLFSDETKDAASAHLIKALANSKLPRNISDKIRDDMSQNDNFISSLHVILHLDPYLWILVDKEHPLGPNYEPNDLVQLRSGLYSLNNHEVLMLRGIAASSLEQMAAASRKEGITLVVSYTYRSFTRQNQSYSMHVRNLGQREADRVSARPGYSQHQLGLTIDFDSVTNEFARTAQGIWLFKNASRFGWSLSYPSGYEAVTGYSWESWHYRYVGRELAEFIDKYFNGIQQYALRFLHEYVNFSL